MHVTIKRLTRDLGSWAKPIVAAVFFVASTAPLLAAERVALVIGNSAYVNTPKLQNPGNDADDIAASLKALGFEVIEAHDLDKAGMDRTVRQFAEAVSGAKVGLFYYAGHGLQVNGQNYLVPVDAVLSTASALDFEMVRLDLIHRTMESAGGTNIIILDACRDNPLSRNLARALGTRSTSIGRGLAPVESGEGTLISFSTQPGSVALDGDGRNSPFAASLAKHIRTPGDDLSSVLINVRNDVMEATGRRQVPWEHSAMTARFYFVPQTTTDVAVAKDAQGASTSPAGTPAGPTYEQQSEMAFWGAVKDSGSPLIIQTYLDRFPQGTFSGLAKALIERLKKEEEAKATAQRQAEQANAEKARQAAEALSEAARTADVGKQSEVLLKTKDDAVKAAEQKLAAAEAAAADARLAAERAKQDKAALVQNKSPHSVQQFAAVNPMMLDTSTLSLDDPETLARHLQSELLRVGCDPGDIDGHWGAKGRAALTEFAEKSKLALPVDEPTSAALQAVATTKEPVCGASCDEGEIKRDGECVKASRSRSVSDDDDGKRERSSRRSASNSDGKSSRTSTRRTSSSSSSNRSRAQSNGDALIGAAIIGAAIGISVSKSSRHRSSGSTSTSSR